jgi:hypothetical protein
MMYPAVLESDPPCIFWDGLLLWRGTSGTFWISLQSQQLRKLAELFNQHPETHDLVEPINQALADWALANAESY